MVSAVQPDIPLATVFRGALPFVIADFIAIGIFLGLARDDYLAAGPDDALTAGNPSRRRPFRMGTKAAGLLNVHRDLPDPLARAPLPRYALAKALRNDGGGRSLMTKTMTLEQVAEAMVAPGKGILAADESTGTIGKRFDSIKTENIEDNRRDYREMLFRSSDAMKNHISGVILYDETIRQKAKDGTPLTKLIEPSGSLPGIKVDKGTKPLPFNQGETITEGLDGLAERIKDYAGLGAKLRSGAQCMTSPVPASRATPRSIRMPTRSPATRRCASRAASCRSWNRNC